MRRQQFFLGLCIFFLSHSLVLSADSKNAQNSRLLDAALWRTSSFSDPRALASFYLASAGASAHMDLPKNLSENDVVTFQAIIKEYIENHPEIIERAFEQLADIREKRTQTEREKAIVANHKRIFQDDVAPTVGSKDSQVKIVIFFDYNCGFCKKMAEPLDLLLKTDLDVQVIFKELPIFGPISEQASAAALAAHEQGKYLPMHYLLMNNSGKLTKKQIFKFAEQLKLDMPQFSRSFKSQALRKILLNNQLLASELLIDGTPALIIGNTLVSGYLDLQKLLQLVKEERNRPKKMPEKEMGNKKAA